MIYLWTALRLGIVNIARAATYRSCKRFGIYRWMLPAREVTSLQLEIDSPCSAAEPSEPWVDRSVLRDADELLKGRVNYFSAHLHDVGNPPNWFLDPFESKLHMESDLHWSKIADFCTERRDIKVIWEISRFSWATIFARAWRTSGDARYLSALKLWMQDWWRCNPPNTGPNWMCGQEISIRLINTLLALRIAGVEENVGPTLLAFVEAHCRRINLTTLYAVAQDNNHATSEAVGLFVGGTWLSQRGDGSAKGRGHRWAEKGRKLLEHGVRRLVLTDGSFSQHSLTYHRLMLDSLSVAEAWRRASRETPFAKDFYARATAATRWLGAMIDRATGDGPNLGANDGAHPYRLDCSDYRDFRPCLQLASLLFTSGAALKAGPWDASAAWLGVRVTGGGRPWLKEPSSSAFPDGGYWVMHSGTGARVLLRAPTARFRPSHADALHVDLWWKGTNILRDGGTYTYADDGTTAAALASVVGHNVVQFDDHDQMLRLGRFLYGDWVRVNSLSGISSSGEGQFWTGSYIDCWGARHKRAVSLGAKALSVTDCVLGFKRKAVWRWRLAPGNWLQNETGCVSGLALIRVESSVPICDMSLKDGWESRHYLEKSSVPVLEVMVDQSPAALTTTITLL